MRAEGAEVEEKATKARRGRNEAAEAFEEALLVGLSEGHAEAGKDVNEGVVGFFIAAMDVEWNDLLDAPVRDELGDAEENDTSYL